MVPSNKSSLELKVDSTGVKFVLKPNLFSQFLFWEEFSQHCMCKKEQTEENPKETCPVDVTCWGIWRDSGTAVGIQPQPILFYFSWLNSGLGKIFLIPGQSSTTNRYVRQTAAGTWSLGLGAHHQHSADVEIASTNKIKGNIAEVDTLNAKISCLFPGMLCFVETRSQISRWRIVDRVLIWWVMRGVRCKNLCVNVSGLNSIPGWWSNVH